MIRRMSLAAPGNARPRATPYDLVFGAGPFESERFPEIRDEGRARGVRATDPDAFVQLQAVGRLLRELTPDDAPGSAVLEVGRLLFHAYHFWLFGKHVLIVDEPLARRLLAAPPIVGEWQLAPPQPAGYLQLPRNLLWARAQPDAPPEPVDGLFWAMIGEADAAVPPYPRLDALLALGLRADRPGLTVVDVSTPLGDLPGHFADARGRDQGADFANVLPGGELAGLFALVSRLEALKLLSLCFWQAAHPDALAELRPDDGAAFAAPAGTTHLLLRDTRSGG